MRRVIRLLALGGWLVAGMMAAQTNTTINGTTSYQTMNGVGTNVHTWAWKSGELTPALDLLVDTLHYNVFRVIHDRMEWAGTGSTRPATTLTNLAALDATTLQTVYETADMQDLWNTIGYLNSKGVTGDQIVVNFMGWTAVWMGGSGQYNVVSAITNNTQTNQDIATMLASLVYYGHHRRDVSGANTNLSFGYLAPFNEPDWNGLEGPQLAAAQLATIYGNIVTTLNGMGDSTTKLMGPDVASVSNADTYTAAFSTAVKARMAHFAMHDYSGSAISPQTARSGVPADWMTETTKWCTGCDTNEPPGESEWSFGLGTADLLAGDIGNGFAAALNWEGFDAFYYHHNSYSAWGSVGCTQSGSGCTTSDATARVYAVRVRAYPQAVLAMAIKPGMKRIAVSGPAGVNLLAFYDSGSGKFALFGHNTNGGSSTLNVAASNVGTLPAALDYVYTTSALNLSVRPDVAVSSGAFTVVAPAASFFVVRNFADTAPPASTRRVGGGHKIGGGRKLQ